MQAESLKSSGFPMAKLMLTADNIRQPIDVVHVLRKYGMSLRKAHDVLTRLARREVVAVELYIDDANKLFSLLSDVGVNADLIQIPDIDVKRLRERFALSQADFALHFGLEVDTIRNWEQRRNIPDQSTRLLLKIIDSCPEVVEAALTNRQSRQYLNPYTSPTPSPSRRMDFHEGARHPIAQVMVAAAQPYPSIIQQISGAPLASLITWANDAARLTHAIAGRNERIAQLEAENKRLRETPLSVCFNADNRRHKASQDFEHTMQQRALFGVQVPQGRTI
jgi:DNA-binding transcriptional regulator YiaG